jgi:hypothetical protein
MFSYTEGERIINHLEIYQNDMIVVYGKLIDALSNKILFCE